MSSVAPANYGTVSFQANDQDEAERRPLAGSPRISLISQKS